MSHAVDGESSRRRGGGLLRLLLVLVAIAALLVGGSRLSAQSATFRPIPIPVVGRTTSVCTVAPPEPGSSTSVSTVVIRQAPGRAGTLTSSALGQPPNSTQSEQGLGRLRTGQAVSQLLRGEGVAATASSGEVFSTGTSGALRGLMAAPCEPPGTSHWFVGVGADASTRSEIFLSNPDDAQAVVDLQFFGATGEVVVPGSPGIVVESQGSRTIALESLLSVSGPVTVSVVATRGRVAAIARDLRSNNLTPAGADWHASAVPPSTQVVIPGVAAGTGARTLVVANPGTAPATVGVDVLALTGPFAPTGAEQLEVPARGTATVDLAAGLAGQAGAVRLSSDQPVTGAVLASSSRPGAAPDLAVQSATPPLVRTGVVALAAATGIDSELVLSNPTDEPAPVSLELLSFDGGTLRTDDVLIGPGATSTRRLDVAGPAYLVLTVPAGSTVHGAVGYTQPEGPVAGLAGVSLTSPDVASRAPNAVPDPTVGR